MNNVLNQELDIVDEAMELIREAKKENYDLTFTQTLEVIKIRHIETISKYLKSNNQE